VLPQIIGGVAMKARTLVFINWGIERVRSTKQSMLDNKKPVAYLSSLALDKDSGSAFAGAVSSGMLN
jgi:hypothetical protein